jgi:peptidoglycan/xylan/chitin deacetylase (PgdA/CDA1 family)
MKAVIVILLISLALSSSHALYPADSKIVIVRIDDIKDSSYAFEKTLIQYHLDRRVPALLAIIGSSFGKEPELIDQIKKGLDQKMFTLAIHGWNHIPYTQLSLSAQTADMEYAKNRLNTIFGVQISAFVPPYSSYNDATIDAMKRNHLTLMSSGTYVGDLPREEDGIMFIPETVTTANVEAETQSWIGVPLESMIQQIQDSWDNYGLAVILIHPQQFTGQDYEERWDVYVQMIEWVQANHGTIIRPEPPEPAQEYRLDSLSLSVGIITGMASTLIVVFGVAATRKKRQRKTGE